jgi:hypothetical protein
VSLYEYYFERFSLADMGSCETFRALAVVYSLDEWNIVLIDFNFSFDVMLTVDK